MSNNPQYNPKEFTANFDFALFSPMGVTWREDATAGSLIDANMIAIDAELEVLAAGGGGGSSVKVNGSTVATPNFNAVAPAAPAGYANIVWQVSGSNVSGYAPVYDTLGAAGAALAVAEAYTDSSVSAEASARSTADALLVPKTTTVNGHALSANVAVTASDLSLAAVASSGAYSDLTGKPQLPNTNTGTTHLFVTAYSAVTGNFTTAQPAASDITGLAAVATSGVYSDLTGKPSIPTSFTWDVEGNAAGNLSINNANFTSTFNQTSAVVWLWANTTAATAAGVNASSPIQELAGAYFTAGASAADIWSMQGSVAASTVCSTVSNATELVSNVVTLVVSGNTLAVGASVTLSGFTNYTWLNGQNVTLTTSTASSISFTDQTSHGSVASHADTGTLTQNNPISTLVFTHSGSSGAPQISIPAQTTPSVPNVISPTSGPANGINVGSTSANIPLSVCLSSAATWMRFYQGATNMGQFSTQASAAYFGLDSISTGPLTLGGASAGNNNTTLNTVPAIVLGQSDRATSGFIATSGTQTGVSHGSNELASANGFRQLNFVPTSGSASWVASRVLSTVNQAVLSSNITNCNITSATSVTLTVASGTGLVNGASITISGCTGTNNAQLNGTWTLTSGGGTTTIVVTGSGWATGNHAEASGALKQQASGSYTGLLVNIVETAIAGTSNKLLDLQAGASGGSSRFNIDNLGNATTTGTHGEQIIEGSSTELLTLSTSGLTTDTVGNLLPANAIIDAVVCRVTTTITTTTNWAVGDASVSSRFSSANATLTSGTTSVGLNQMQGVVAATNAGPTQSAAAKVRITCTGSNPGAGIVRITVFYRQFVAPTS